MVCVTSPLSGSAPSLTPASYPIHHRSRWLPGSGGSRVGFQPPRPSALAGLTGSGDSGRGAPDRVTRPGAARQAASPWDNFQRRRARHGKVLSSEPQSRDSSPGCSLTASLMPPPLSLAQKSRQPTSSSPRRPLFSSRCSPPQPALWGSDPCDSCQLPVPSPLPGHAGQGPAAAVATPGQWSRVQESPA